MATTAGGEQVPGADRKIGENVEEADDQLLDEDPSSLAGSLFSSSSRPALNSLWAEPRERASFGILAPPKMMTTTSRRIRSSGAPRFIADVLSDPRLDRDASSLLGDRRPLRRAEGVGEEIDVAAGPDVERNRPGTDDEGLHA